MQQGRCSSCDRKCKRGVKLDKKEYLISKLREFALTVSERIDITKMTFFGSMATGEAHKDSNIDMIIVSQSFRRVNLWKRAIALFEKKIRRVTIVSEALKESIEIT